ncbi:Nucleolar protein 10 [Hondaea fermentalgiana]|uniref:Nucleolar protein 10 n=1 Tax=Hondaea fermentalgiana TaxID=2315210 RepID=A0A2R5GXA8_9STRA|nr:Nucleolar protein 10 [Hondaea fermentalgiana]|eukprot:GBG33323.1 Nucleolar protein 10 [Hondaea fermentalgiana]
MKAVQHGGVKVYDLNVGKTLPQWISDKNRKSLAKDEEYRRRIELVQDFYFPATSGRVKVSPDGEYIVATGSYPPQVKVYDTRELSMKFERHLDAEVVQVQVLSTDFTKLVFLGNDRTVAFHAAYGRHHMLRIPKFGRDMAYDPAACELFLGGTGSSLYRIDLEQGHFLSPFETSHEGINSLAFCEPLQLLACAGEDGVVSCWDTRDRKQVGALHVSGPEASGGLVEQRNAQASVVRFDASGLMMAVGTSLGRVSVYDVRSSKPLISKEHRNDLPIVGLQFTTPGRIIASADAKSIKLWNRDSGDSFANIEPQADVNDILVVPQGDIHKPSSGLIIAPGETDRIMSYYVPRLGAAPKWASFLDNLTEELEEKSHSAEELYENYKFVTNNDLERLGITNLLGTSLLRPYMHGFFIDMRLYNKVKAISQPLGFEDWRKERIRKKMEERLGQRISRKLPDNLPKVNRDLAARIAAREAEDNSMDAHDDDEEEEEDEDAAWSSDEEANAASAKKRSKKRPLAITKDDRFKAMFEDPDFQVDEDASEFKQSFPSGLRKERAEQAARDIDSDEDNAGHGAADSDSDDEPPAPRRVSKSKANAPKSAKKKRKVIMRADEISAHGQRGEDGEDGDFSKLLEHNVEDDEGRSRRGTAKKSRRTKAKTLGEQLRDEAANKEFERLEGGNMELSFIPRGEPDEGDGAPGPRRKRKSKGGKGKF